MPKPDSFFIHPQALVDDGVSIGARTRVWAFAHILKGAVIGEECNICDHTLIEGKVEIANRVTLKCGVYLWDGMVVEDDVFIGPNATFVNDLRPRSGNRNFELVPTLLRTGCSIGANATILGRLTVGQYAMVAAGAVVTRDVPAYALVVGNPARFRDWVCQCTKKLFFAKDCTASCSCGRRYRLGGEDGGCLAA